MTKSLELYKLFSARFAAWKDAVAYRPALVLNNALYPGIYSVYKPTFKCR